MSLARRVLTQVGKVRTVKSRKYRLPQFNSHNRDQTKGLIASQKAYLKALQKFSNGTFAAKQRANTESLKTQKTEATGVIGVTMHHPILAQMRALVQPFDIKVSSKQDARTMAWDLAELWMGYLGAEQGKYYRADKLFGFVAAEVLLGALKTGNSKMRKHVLQIVEQSHDQSPLPYETMITFLSSRGQLTEAMKLIDDMNKRGIVSYSVYYPILASCFQQKDPTTGAYFLNKVLASEILTETQPDAGRRVTNWSIQYMLGQYNGQEQAHLAHSEDTLKVAFQILDLMGLQKYSIHIRTYELLLSRFWCRSTEALELIAGAIERQYTFPSDGLIEKVVEASLRLDPAYLNAFLSTIRYLPAKHEFYKTASAGVNTGLRAHMRRAKFGAATFNTMVQGLARTGKIQNVLLAWTEMLNTWQFPNKKSHFYVMKAAGMANEPKLLWDVWHSLLRHEFRIPARLVTKGFQNKEILPAGIQDYLTNKQRTEMLGWLLTATSLCPGDVTHFRLTYRMMQKDLNDGIVPALSLVNILIKCLCRKEWHVEVFAFLDHLHKLPGYVPQESTYRSLLHNVRRTEHMRYALQGLKHMLAKGLKPSPKFEVVFEQLVYRLYYPEVNHKLPITWVANTEPSKVLSGQVIPPLSAEKDLTLAPQMSPEELQAFVRDWFATLNATMDDSDARFLSILDSVDMSVKH